MDTLNFYEELNLDESFSIEEIQDELSRLENLWNHRLVSSPEKASTMLELISDAFEVFRDAKSKEEYDLMLSHSDTTLESTEKNDETLEKNALYEKAKAFFDEGETDLAKITIEKALRYVNDTSEDTKILYLSALITKSKKEFGNSLDYINRAIINAKGKDLALLYDIRNDVCVSLAKASNNKEDYLQFINQGRSSLIKGISELKNTGESDNLGSLYYSLAYSYLTYKEKDIIKAEEFAKQAVSYGYKKADEIISVINNKVELLVDIDELQSTYYKEQNSYEAKIRELIKTIIESEIKPDDKDGWLLESQYFQVWYKEPDFKKTLSNKVYFYLAPNGELIKKIVYDQWQTNGGYYKDVERESVNIDTVCAALDFDVHYGYDDNSSAYYGSPSYFERHGSITDDFSTFAFAGDFTALSIKRIFLKKGQGLYEKLNEIISLNQAIIEKRYSELIAAYQKCMENETNDTNDTVTTLNKLAESFSEIVSYKDSAEWVKTCNSETERIREKIYKQSVSKFNEEIEKFQNNNNPDFETVKTLFLDQNGYKDSLKYLETIEQYIIEQQYRSAVKEAKSSKTKSDFQQVISLFTALSDYKQSKEIIEACKKIIGRLNAAEAKYLADKIENDSALKAYIESLDKVRILEKCGESIRTIRQIDDDIYDLKRKINDIINKMSSLSVFNFAKKRECDAEIMNNKKSIESLVRSKNAILAELGYESIDAIVLDLESNYNTLHSISHPDNPERTPNYYFENGKLYINIEKTIMDIIINQYPEAYEIITKIVYKEFLS